MVTKSVSGLLKAFWEKEDVLIAQKSPMGEDIRNFTIRTKSGAYLGEQVATIGINRRITVLFYQIDQMEVKRGGG